MKLTLNRHVSKLVSQKNQKLDKQDSKAIKKLAKEIETLEGKIKAKEKEIESYNLKLLEASKLSDLSQITKLGKLIKESQYLVLKQHNELDELMKKYLSEG